MPFWEPLWKKREREQALKDQYPEFGVAQSPDKVLQVDNYRLRNGGPVSEWSQTVMRLAKHAAFIAEDTQRGMPDQLQIAQDENVYSGRKKQAGVPRGVAEAFPETAVDRKVYDSGSASPSINLTGSLLDNQEGLPGPLKAALNTPVLGQGLREAARPSNWMSAAIAPLSFAPKAGALTRFGAEIAAGTAGSIVGQEVTDRTGNSLAGFGAGLLAGQVTGAGASRVGGLFGQADNAASAFKNLPDVAQPQMPAVRVPSGGSALSEVLDSVIPGENVGTALLRRYEGRLNTEGLVIKKEIDTGNEYLRASGIGKVLPSGRVRVNRSPEMEQLFKALHGEGDPPLALKPVFDDLKAKVADETGRSVDFDKNFMARPDYFPRGWKAPKQTNLGQSRMGVKPGFTKGRNDLTFSEMLDQGWEPASWNPYEMLALRRVAGAEFREQTDLVRYLQDSGQAIVADGPLPDGYRIPRVGPAFEGKPKIIPSAEEGVLPSFAGYSPRWAVPDHIADVVENMYGSKMSLGKVGPVDVLGAIRGAGTLSKRSKLLGSLFQQVDFSTRVGFAQFGGAVDALTRGHPVEAVAKTLGLPAEIGKLAYANVSAGRRAALRDQILSGAPIFKDRPGITLNGISKAGWSQTDITILPRDIRSVLDFDTPKNLPAQALSAATGEIRKLDKAMNDGLFDGVYPQAQITALRNFVVPSISRQHPDWTDEQIMGSAAVEVNKMFSTLGNFQTIFANRGMRELTRNLIFSTNEPEALIKGAISTVKGPNKRLWAENYIGGVLFLAGVANAIHIAATGEPLPLDRYSPVTMEKGDGPGGLNFNPLPFNYNSRFMSPNIPGVEGRNGTQVAVDLMGQMDTIFRVLDPNAFLTSRFSAPLRAGVNQLKGEDFYGRPMETPKERIAQAVSDLIAPIGSGNIMGALNIGPDNEGRIGDVGQAIQASGLNLRGETSQQLRDRMASEYAQQQGLEGVSNMDELGTALNLTKSNAEKRVREAFPNFDAELDTRREEQAVGDPETQQKVELDAIKEKARAAQEADDARVLSGEIDWDQWKDNRTRRISEVRGASGLAYGSERIAEPKNAYEEWLNVIRDNETPDGINWDQVDAWVAQQDGGKQKFIEDNTGLYGTPLEKERRAVADKLDEKQYFDIRDRVWQKIAQRDDATKDFKTVDEFRNALAGRIKNKLQERGIDVNSAAADIIVNDVLEKIPQLEAWTKVSNVVEEAWIKSYPELAADAVKYGYLSPGSLRKAEKAAVMAAGR